MKYKIFLFGYPLTHSLSPKFHNAEFQKLSLPLTYQAYPIEKSNFDKVIWEVLRQEDFLGANVTIPYKTDIIPYLDELDEEAEKIEAVNTVVKRCDGTLKGYNTDVPAILQALRENGVNPVNRAFILGSGGSAMAALSALKNLGCGSVTVAFRSEKRLKQLKRVARKLSLSLRCVPLDEILSFYEWAEQRGVLEKSLQTDAGDFVAEESLWKKWRGTAHNQRTGTKNNEEVKKFDLLINATPVGMSPNIDEAIIDYPNFFRLCRWVMDFVYNPSKTKFLFCAELAGCKVISGLGMFYRQAELSRDIWMEELMRRQKSC